MRNKLLVAIFVFSVSVLLVSVAFYIKSASANVVVKTLSEKKVAELVEFSEELRGEKLADVKEGKLELVYTEVKPHTAFFEFVDQSSRDGVVLYCDAESNSLNIGYRGDMVSAQEENLLDGFSIMKIRKGSKGIYEADDRRPAVFDTHEGHSRLMLSLEDLKYEDQNDGITFSLRYHGPNGESMAGGYSPVFKIKDVLRAIKQVPLGACDFVELADVPMPITN